MELLRKAWILVAGVVLVSCGFSEAGEVRLAQGGKSACVIVVPENTMTWEGDDVKIDRWGRAAGLGYKETQVEKLRRLRRDSISDLAHYLQKITGAEVNIANKVPAQKGIVPIYIAGAAQKVFGPVGISRAGLFGFRVVVNAKGIGLYGESGFGTSYAIYELLHRLGCRWYIPSEMGECIPSDPDLAVTFMDEKLAPATEMRRMEVRTADEDFRRRNRMNGTAISAQHALEGYITKEQREEHPEWCLLVDGKPHPSFLRWTRQDVADAIGDAIIARLDEKYVPSISLSPGDYVVPADDPEERKFDPEPRVWEPAANRWSVTDRLILLANRVAERVGKKYPEVKFGLLAYVNYSMPPAKYKVHPNVIPELAPIDFNRHHPMTWKDHPNDQWLLDMVKGWGKMAPNMAYYAYGMNLAEITAPNPFITKWGTDIPIILENNCTYWQPETMGGWESMMPGFYLSIRMSFYPDEKPDAILNELYDRLYGNAAEPMKKYWEHIDSCWVNSNEYAGSLFGYLKMFTPERMAEARKYIDDALGRCENITEYRRVKLIDESLSLFALFMEMREDWASGNWGKMFKLGDKYAEWAGSVRHLRRAYRKQYSFDSGLAVTYMDWQVKRSYEEASKMIKGANPIAKTALEWKYKFDEEKKAEELGWIKPDFDDAEWPETHVVRDSWSSIGHHNTMGRMVYRQEMTVHNIPQGKKLGLWIGSEDGKVKVFVNGKHIPYVVPQDTRHNKKGDVLEEVAGYCAPFKFEVTDAIVKGKNEIAIMVERYNLNELGSGGLMGPVILYSEK